MSSVVPIVPKFKNSFRLSGNRLVVWRVSQMVFWIAGLVILVALFSFPQIGLILLWKILIPVAPILFVVALGIWRNVCPLGTTSMLPHHLGISGKLRISNKWLNILSVLTFLLLLILVPARHLFMNTSGPATGFVIIAMGFVAVVSGLFVDWKSGWCLGLCPVYPVEKLYGIKPGISFDNAHCTVCEKCITPCADSTPNITPASIKHGTQYIPGVLLIGGFPGFIWGWFHVRDYSWNEGLQHLGSIYGYPLAAMAITFLLYMIIVRIIPQRYESILISLFVFTSVSCYYWYNLLALIGFGLIPGQGVLVDMSDSLPSWTPTAIRLVLLIFFGWFLVLRKSGNKNWLIRPPYAKGVKVNGNGLELKNLSGVESTIL